MPDLTKFSRRIQARADRIPHIADAIVRKAALAADQAVVTGTPVDVGRARSNWIVSLDQPASETIDAYYPGENRSTESQNTQAALDQGEEVVKNYRGGVGQEIHITNNLEYIIPLNNGHSDQAPANFVELGVMEAVQAVRSAKLLDDREP